MIKFTKTRDPDNTFDYDNVEITLDKPDMTLPEIIDAFNRFLVACTYGEAGIAREMYEFSLKSEYVKNLDEN